MKTLFHLCLIVLAILLIGALTVVMAGGAGHKTSNPTSTMLQDRLTVCQAQIPLDGTGSIRDITKKLKEINENYLSCHAYLCSLRASADCVRTKANHGNAD